MVSISGCKGDPAGTPDAGKADGLLADGNAVPCVDFPASIPTDYLVKKGCYLCKQTPKISAGVKVTMEPGVKIVFSENVGLTFASEQVLAATGTAAEPILFTGSQPTRGHWKGVSFEGTSKPENRLDHVTIEHAGRTKADTNAAAVRVVSNGHASLTHVTLRESQGWGLWLDGSALIGEFKENTLTKNTLGPAGVNSETAGVLDAASSYKGNDRDQIVVKAQYLQKNATWSVTEVPYYLATSLRVSADWTLSPGVTLIMAKETWIEISGDAGALIAKGTAQKPILFTAEQKQRGGWAGFRFDGSNNTKNTLSYATVEYAGDTVSTSDKDNAAVKLIGDSHGVQLRMDHTTLRESQGWGLNAVGSAVLPGFEGNTLTKNTLGPALVGTEAVHQLLPASTYTGNDVDRVFVRDSYVSKSVTWEALDVPYQILKSIVPNKAVLTLAPGVTLLMDAGTWINVGGDASGLHAVGTAQKPILITGVQKTKGAWESIVFDTTLNGQNALTYCTIEYGGGGTAKGWKGMVLADSDSHGVSLSLTNSKLQHSNVYGLWEGHYAAVTQSGNSFADNTLGDTFKTP